MTKPKVLISLLIDRDTKQADFCKCLLDLLYNSQHLAPEFANNYEPVNNPVSSSAATLAFCQDNPFFWLRKHKIVSHGSLFHTYRGKAGALIVNASFDASFDWLTFFRDLVIVTSAHYGYLHLQTKTEWEETSLSLEDRQIFLFLGVSSRDVDHGGVLDLGWANYFGERWKRQINPIKLAGHCSRMEHVQSGYLFATTDDINDVHQNFSVFTATRQAVKGAFTRDFFRAP